MPSQAKTTTSVRLSKVFSSMLTECPTEINVYGACVAETTGGVSKDLCEKEFAKLRECFQRTLKSSRGGRKERFAYRGKMTLEMHQGRLHEDADGALSSDNDSDSEGLQDEASVRQALVQAQQEMLDIESETSADFVDMLATLKKDQARRIGVAKATNVRYVQSIEMLYEYECKQASDNYDERCVQLKDEMSAEVQREIAQLVSTRDGVSVMDRRRRAPRGVNNDSNGIGGGFNDRSSSQDPAIQAIVDWQRLEYDEKKELEALLAKAHVFPLLDKQAKAAEVKSDLRSIAQVVVSAHVDRSTRSDEQEEEETKQEPMDHASMQQIESSSAQRYEGQQVAVFRDHSLELEGVLTALTETQAFVMTGSGGFESIDRREWAAGQLKVLASAPT